MHIQNHSAFVFSFLPLQCLQLSGSQVTRLCQWLNGNLSARPSEQLPMGRKTEPSIPPALEYGWAVVASGKLHCSSPRDQGSEFRRSWLRVFYLKPNQQRKKTCFFFMSRNTSDKTNLKSYTNQQNFCRCSTFFLRESEPSEKCHKSSTCVLQAGVTNGPFGTKLNNIKTVSRTQLVAFTIDM